MKSVYKLYWENQCALSALVSRAGVPLQALLAHPAQFPAAISSELRLILERRAAIIMQIMAVEGRKNTPDLQNINVISMDEYRLINSKPK